MKANLKRNNKLTVRISFYNRHSVVPQSGFVCCPDCWPDRPCPYYNSSTTAFAIMVDLPFSSAFVKAALKISISWSQRGQTIMTPPLSFMALNLPRWKPHSLQRITTPIVILLSGVLSSLLDHHCVARPVQCENSIIVDKCFGYQCYSHSTISWESWLISMGIYYYSGLTTLKTTSKHGTK